MSGTAQADVEKMQIVSMIRRELQAARLREADLDIDAKPAARGSAAEVFRVLLSIGLTSFGGPVAHLGYFRETFVVRRKWLSEQAYADLVALCQFLPGPASSQVGMAIGLGRA